MRLIDADALASALNNGRLKEQTGRAVPFNAGVAFALTMVEYAPTIDAVPVVRCKDCVYRVIVRDPLMKTMDCYGCKVMHYNEDDWFCSFGERKDDGRTCDTCKHYDKWWDDIICDGCTKAYSNWERRDDE